MEEIVLKIDRMQFTCEQDGFSDFRAQEILWETFFVYS